MAGAADEGRHELDTAPWSRVEGTLMSTARAVHRVYDRFLAEVGLNLTEASILAHLDREDGLAQVELARRIGTSRARVGVHIDGLQGKGAVERRSDPADRRVRVVHLTQAGRESHRRSVEVDRHVRRHLRTGTTEEERELLDHLLTRIQRNAETIPDRTLTEPRHPK